MPKDFDNLPDFVKKLWELNPSLAREAEVYFNRKEKISSSEMIAEADKLLEAKQSSKGYDIRSFSAGFFEGIAFMIRR